ncbi:cupin domain-containing protein [Streptomyces sp. 12297]
MDPLTHVTVVPRQDIPSIGEVLVDGRTIDLGEQRDFRRNDTLARFLPEDSRLSLSWTHLPAGRTLEPHVHPTASMILVTQGSGRVVGQTEAEIGEGDAVLVPAGCSHGFEGGGEKGLFALSVQFEGAGLYEDPADARVRIADRATSLDELMAYNERRLAAHVDIPFFRLLRDGALYDEAARGVFLDLLQSWSATFQRLMFLRQGLCTREPFEGVYRQHLAEEYGHDGLLTPAVTGKRRRDPVVEATGTWFLNRIISFDELEKTALVHLVLETSADAFHTEAAKLFADDELLAPYFGIHSDHDEGHAELGVELVSGQHPRTYLRLHEVLEESWDMLEAMLDRMATLVLAERG